MVTSRPRAHSASSIKLTLVSSRENPASHSTPELRSMLTGLETTVPQNLTPDDFSTTHRPRRMKKRPAKMTSASSRDAGCCACCKRCCRGHIFFVMLQVLLGSGITGLSFYVSWYYPVVRLRETPYWAGIPLSVAGLVGIYFCCVKFSSSLETTISCAVKALCFVFSIIAIFVSVIASVFPAIHLGRIFTFVKCRMNFGRCECYDSNSRVFLYSYVTSCEFVREEMTYYLFLIGGLCLLGSLISLCFVILLWRQRYGRFYSGADGDTPVLRRRKVKVDLSSLPPEN